MIEPATCAADLPFSSIIGSEMDDDSHSPEECMRIVSTPMAPASP